MNEKTLTSEQRATLIAYILMTTKMREEEAAAWDKLAEEKTAGGQPRFRHAAENCDNCPNEALRGSALWYLTLPVESCKEGQ